MQRLYHASQYALTALLAIVASSTSVLAQDSEEGGDTSTSAEAGSASGEGEEGATEAREKSVVERTRERLAQYNRKGPIDDDRDRVAFTKVQAEILRHYPHLTADAGYDIRDIKNPTDPEERELYTEAMLDIVEMWNAAGEGHQLALILTEQREEKIEQPVFLCIQAMQDMLYPWDYAVEPSETPILAVEGAIDRAGDAGFAAPHLIRARCYFAMWSNKVYQQKLSAKKEQEQALVSVKLARKYAPENLEAKLLHAQLLREWIEMQNARQDAVLLAKEVIAARPKQKSYFQHAVFFLMELLPIEERIPYLKELSQAESLNSAHKAIVFSHLGAQEMLQRNYEQAQAHATTVLGLIDHSEHREIVDFAVFRIEIPSYVARYKVLMRKNDPDNGEEVEKLRTKIEERLEWLTQFDLENFSVSYQNKARAPMEFARFLVGNERAKEAIALLRSYDKQSHWLHERTRRELRKLLDTYEAQLSGSLPIDAIANDLFLKEYSKVLDQLVFFRDRMRKEPDRYELDEPAVDKLIECLKLPYIGIARVAFEMLDLGLKPTEAGAALVEKVVDAVGKRLSQQKSAEEDAEAQFFRAGITCLSGLGGDGLNEALVQLDRFDESLRENDGFRKFGAGPAVTAVFENSGITEADLSSGNWRTFKRLASNAASFPDGRRRGQDNNYLKQFIELTKRHIKAKQEAVKEDSSGG